MRTDGAMKTGGQADTGHAGQDGRGTEIGGGVCAASDDLPGEPGTGAAQAAAVSPGSGRCAQDRGERRGVALDGAMPSGDALACGPPPATHIALIDPDVLAWELGTASAFDDDYDEPRSTSHEDRDRRAFLRRYADRPGGILRRQIITDAATDARLEALRAEAPNGAPVIDILRRAALLSWHTRTPLRTPPILILGPAGVGKTRLARRVSLALGTTLTIIDGGTTTDRGPIVGHEPGYRGSGPGKVACGLLDGDTAGPVLLLEEVDKVSSYGAGHGVQPLDALLGLLEPTTAASFVDTYIGLPMHAEGVVWLFTANSTARLPGPLLDRVVVVEMGHLGRAEMRAALHRLLAELLAEHGLPAATLGDAALNRLETAGLRQARRTLALALGPAVAAGRAAPGASDIAGAAALLEGPARRARGLPRQAKPVATARAPVGFIHFASATPDVVRSKTLPPRRRRP